MKRLTYYIFSALLLLLAGCDTASDLGYDFSASSGKTVSFSATLPTASGYEWVEGDAVGIYSASYVSTKNLKFTIDDIVDGLLLYSTQNIYLGSVNTADYSAYFPYSNQVEGTSFNFDINDLSSFDYIEEEDSSTEEEDTTDDEGDYSEPLPTGSGITISEIGLLWGKVTSSQSDVTLSLAQQFASVGATIEMEDGSSLPSKLTATLCNVYSSAKFNFESGEFYSQVVGNATDVAVESGAFELRLFPQDDLSNVKFLFSDGSTLYTATSGADIASWLAGEEYEYILKIAEYSAVDGVELSTESGKSEIIVDQGLEIDATLADGEYVAIEWRSSNESVTLEIADDLLSAVATGSVVGEESTITIYVYLLGQDEPIAATYDVTIIAAPIPVEQILLSVDDALEGDGYGEDLMITIGVGESFSLAAILIPDEATYRGYTWATSGENADCVSYTAVDDSAIEVSGASSGSATITATSSEYEDLSTSISVTVKDYVTAVEFSGATSVVVDTQSTITAQMTGTEYDSINWELDTTTAAQITAGQGSESITIKGLTVGKTVVVTATISLTDGREDVVGTYSVAVVDADIAVTQITLPANASVAIGGSVTLTPTFTPVEATNLAYTWSVSDPNGVATYTETATQPLTITGDAVGSLTVSVTASDTTNGTLTASCIVEVTPILATNIVLSEELKILKVGDQSFSLSAMVDAGATYDDYEWSISGDTSAVSTTLSDSTPISITPASEGVAIVTATTKDGSNQSARCSVVVQKSSPATADYYYDNKTYSSASMLDKFKAASSAFSVIGVVFQVDANNQLAYVAHINTPNSTTVNWATSANTYATTKINAANVANGVATMAKAQLSDSSFASLPAFKVAHDLNNSTIDYSDEDNNQNIWYLPSAVNLGNFLTWIMSYSKYATENNVDAVDKLFDDGGRASSSPNFGVGSGSMNFWSTYEPAAATARKFYLRAAADYWYDAKDKDTEKHYVTPIMEFAY